MLPEQTQFVGLAPSSDASSSSQHHQSQPWGKPSWAALLAARAGESPEEAQGMAGLGRESVYTLSHP